MKKLLYVCIILLIASCQNSSNRKMHVSGEIKGAENQEVYLEKLSFNQQPPQIVDSAKMTDGKFSMKTSTVEEGLYRVRFANNPDFLIINDQSDIHLMADAKDSSLRSARASSPATSSLYNLILKLDSVQTALMLDDQTRQMYQQNHNDSMAAEIMNRMGATQKWYGDYVAKYTDSTKSPIVSLFALSYAATADEATVMTLLDGIKKRWPDNTSVKEVATQIEAYAQAQGGSDMRQGLAVGTKAPEITMDDTNGKPFSLSSLRGKYVLVDFWASWCQPCRIENPNVVAAYNEFKDKNFTILGVSLDQTKDNWLKAIHDDNLDWHQISDLKFWESAAVPVYNIQGIPYNVLIDPQGTIIASELRGPALMAKLSEVLK